MAGLMGRLCADSPRLPNDGYCIGWHYTLPGMSLEGLDRVMGATEGSGRGEASRPFLFRLLRQARGAGPNLDGSVILRTRRMKLGS
jgi:hypothetical protein